MRCRAAGLTTDAVVRGHMNEGRDRVQVTLVGALLDCVTRDNEIEAIEDDAGDPLHVDSAVAVR